MSLTNFRLILIFASCVVGACKYFVRFRLWDCVSSLVWCGVLLPCFEVSRALWYQYLATSATSTRTKKKNNNFLLGRSADQASYCCHSWALTVRATILLLYTCLVLVCRVHPEGIYKVQYTDCCTGTRDTRTIILLKYTPAVSSTNFGSTHPCKLRCWYL